MKGRRLTRHGHVGGDSDSPVSSTPIDIIDRYYRSIGFYPSTYQSNLISTFMRENLKFGDLNDSLSHTLCGTGGGIPKEREEEAFESVSVILIIFLSSSHSLTNHRCFSTVLFYFYYKEQIKRELKRIHISGCRCNERLKAKTDGSKRLAYTIFF